MKTKTITIILLIVTLTVWLIWDFIVAHNPVKGDTISEITLATSYVATFIPAAWGIIAGHLWWPVEKVTHKWTRMYFLAAWGIVLLALNVFQVIPGTKVTVPIIFLTHFVLGHVLWPQQVAPKERV